MKHLPIPSDYEVQPLKPGQHARHRCTCGTCGLSWDDGISTSITPTPSARCPFESFHLHPEEGEYKYRVLSVLCYGKAESGPFVELEGGQRVYDLPGHAPYLLSALEGLLASAPEPDKNIRKSYNYRVNIEAARKALQNAKGSMS